MKELLSKVFQNIQNLQIQPTETNVMLLADCMLSLKKVYNSLPPEPEANPEENMEEQENAGE
jgi:hypothetical protein